MKKRAITKTDWPIARLVGSATYAQLMDAAPGLFEPFYDWRGDGGSSNSLSHFAKFEDADIPPELIVPTPPNLVSTILYDGNLSGSVMKCLLLKACETGKIDPRIEPLVGSSIAYKNPILTLNEILVIFVIFSFAVSFFVAIVMR